MALTVFRVSILIRDSLFWRDAYFGSSREDAEEEIEDILENEPQVSHIKLLETCPEEEEWKVIWSIMEVD